MEDFQSKQAIARFASSLAELNDEESLTTRLCEASRRMLDCDGVAMTLNYLNASRLTLYASNDWAERLEDLQEVVGEGPGYDAARSGNVVIARFGADDDGLWDVLRQRLTQIEFTGAVIAMPLRGERETLGVLTMHRDDPIDQEVVGEAQFLGSTVGLALVEHSHDVATTDASHDAWSHRSKVHQATGMVVAQVGLRPEDAMALLRGQAFARGVSLESVAAEIVDRSINFRDFRIEGD